MPTMQLTVEEARHIMKRRRSERRDAYFQEGLVVAADEVLKWDGIGATHGQLKMMSNAILHLKRPRNAKLKQEV